MGIMTNQNAFKLKVDSISNMIPSDLNRSLDDFIFKSPVWLFGVMLGFLLTDSGGCYGKGSCDD